MQSEFNHLIAFFVSIVRVPVSAVSVSCGQLAGIGKLENANQKLGVSLLGHWQGDRGRK